jgi:hypothetical protein
MHYYCTYFDKSYLVRAIALHQSLLEHEREAFTLFAVCLDELTLLLLNRLHLSGVVTVPLHEIEAGDEGLRLARLNRNLTEYYWTLTPTVILHLLEKDVRIDVITYMDADLFFFSSPAPVFDELDGYSVLIHEHRFSYEFKPALEFGRFNVGLLCFRRDSNAVAILNWWRERCNEWCYCRLENGKYGDQLYLDCWPEQFNGVKVLEHIGAGVAPWNNLQYTFVQDSSGRVTVDGFPLIFYHFHGLLFAHASYVVLSKLPAHKFTAQIILFCYLPYVRALHQAIDSIRRIMPEFYFGLTEPAAIQLAAIVRNASNLELRHDGGMGSVRTISLDDAYTLLTTEQVISL